MLDAFDEVLAAARAGAEWAWRILYDDLAPDLLRYARASRVSDPDDLVGDVFLRSVDGIGRFRGGEREFRAWIFTMARHRVIDEGRSSRRRRTDPLPHEALTRLGAIGDVESEAMLDLAEERVRLMLGHLTRDQRDVLLLRILAGLTIEEVATVLGKRVGAVKSLQARAIAAIKREISRGAVSL